MKKHVKNTSLLFLFNWIFALTGDELILQMENKPNPNNTKVNMSMFLTNKKGKTRSTTIHSIIKDNGKKQIIWFLSPADDKGIAFLKIEHANKDDEMHIWLPAFKKIKRISSKKKSDSFMGSDMSYEDMSTRKRGDYDFNIIGLESYNDVKCHLLKSIPKNHVRSEYAMHQTWIDSSLLIPLKENSYDKNGKLLKEKIFSYVKMNTYQILKEIQVKNVQKNHSTQLIFDDIKLNTKIKDEIFHERYLKHMPKLEK